MDDDVSVWVKGVTSHHTFLYALVGQMDEEENKLVIAAKAVTHHKCPEVNQVVRVQRYQSQMVIEPHKSIDEVGISTDSDVAVN